MTTKLITLSNNCPICNNPVYLYENAVRLDTGIYHLVCYKKNILDKIDKRILELEEFDGLMECELQKAELRNVKQIIIKEFGDLKEK